MKLLLALMISITALIGCGYEEKTTYYIPSKDGDKSHDDKFAEILPTLKGSCLVAGCHANGAIVDITTEEAYENSNSKARIENGSMPPSVSKAGQDFDEDKKKLLLSFFE